MSGILNRLIASIEVERKRKKEQVSFQKRQEKFKKESIEREKENVSL